MAEPEIEALRLRLTSPRMRSKFTIGHYVGIARQFMAATKARPPTSDDVRRWLAKQKKLKDSSKTTLFYSLKKLFQANKWAWDFEKGEAPVPGAKHGIAMPVENIEKLIQAAIRGVLSPQQAAYVALSTTYGLRRIEISRITREDIGEDILIKSAKGEEERHQPIPRAIRPYLEAWTWAPTSENLIGLMFPEICRRAGVKHEPTMGWHALRRSLVTLLLERHSMIDVWVFMRWKLSTQMQTMGINPMMGTYRHSEILKGSAEERILADHPFVKLWRKEALKELEGE